MKEEILKHFLKLLKYILMFFAIIIITVIHVISMIIVPHRFMRNISVS